MEDGLNNSNNYPRKLCVQKISEWVVTDYTEVNHPRKIHEILTHFTIPVSTSRRIRKYKCETLGFELDMGVMMHTSKKLKK